MPLKFELGLTEERKYQDGILRLEVLVVKEFGKITNHYCRLYESLAGLWTEKMYFEPHGPQPKPSLNAFAPQPYYAGMALSDIAEMAWAIVEKELEIR